MGTVLLIKTISGEILMAEESESNNNGQGIKNTLVYDYSSNGFIPHDEPFFDSTEPHRVPFNCIWRMREVDEEHKEQYYQALKLFDDQRKERYKELNKTEILLPENKIIV